jgi:hypothetical protein
MASPAKNEKKKEAVTPVTDDEWIKMKRHLLEHRTPAGNIVFPNNAESDLFYSMIGETRESHGQPPRQPAYIVTCIAEAFRRALQGVEKDTFDDRTESAGEVLVIDAGVAEEAEKEGDGKKETPKLEIWEDASFNNPASDVEWANMRRAIMGIQMATGFKGENATLIKDDGKTTVMDVVERISGGNPDAEEPTIVRAYVEMFRRFTRRLSAEEGECHPIGAKEPFVAGDAKKWMPERRISRLVGIRTMMRKHMEALLAEIRLAPEKTAAELVAAKKWSWAYQKDPLYTLREGVVFCQGMENPWKYDSYGRRDENNDWQTKCKLQLFFGLGFMQQEDLIMRAATPEDESELALESRKFFEGLWRDLSGFLCAHCWAMPADLLFKGVKYQLTLIPAIDDDQTAYSSEYNPGMREINHAIDYIKRDNCLDTALFLLYTQKAKNRVCRYTWEQLKAKPETVKMLVASLEHARPHRELSPELFDMIAALAASPAQNGSQ